ncbi:MAG: IS3 family transposase [Dehalococcoidia bacterium]
MTSRRRRNFSAAEKVRIVREHLLDDVPVSEVCDRHGLRPSQFYTWQRQLFEKGSAAFARQREPEAARLRRQVKHLEDRLANREEVIAELSSEYVALKKVSWGRLTGAWVAPEARDAVVAFVEHWTKKTGLPVRLYVEWLGISRSKFYDWRRRRGKGNDHNGKVPRHFWLTPWEKKAILDYHIRFPDVGYRRMTYTMLDAGVVAVSAASVYRVLTEAGRLKKWTRNATGKGQGFVQPLGPHCHWHIDVSHINVAGTFHYLCSVIDGFSRYIVAWDLRERMTAGDVEIVLQKAREAFPDASPRVISDNGPAFVAAGFKEFIRLVGFQHTRISPHYPQSNGKIERWFSSAKDALRRKVPLAVQDAQRIIREFVDYYNSRRLHHALGYVPPEAVLEGRTEAIFAERRARLKEAAADRSAYWATAA